MKKVRVKIERKKIIKKSKKRIKRRKVKKIKGIKKGLLHLVKDAHVQDLNIIEEMIT